MQRECLAMQGWVILEEGGADDPGGQLLDEPRERLPDLRGQGRTPRECMPFEK